MGFLLVMIYVIPMGFQDNFLIFTLLRYVFSLCAFLYLMKDPHIPFLSLLLFILFLAKLLFYQEIGLDYLYLGLLFVIYQNWLEELPRNLEDIFKVISWLFILMTFGQTILSFDLPLTINSTIPDRNYTGYFIGFLAIQAYYQGKRRCWLLFILGILTYSRLFLLSLLVFFLFEGLRLLSRQRSLADYFAPLFYWPFQLLSGLVFYLYRYLFNQIDYTYQYQQGLSRFTSLLDASNDLRSQVAIMGLESINPVTFFLGLPEGSFAGLKAFAGKTLYPHHTLLVLHVKFGLLTAIFYGIAFLAPFKGKLNQKFPFLAWLVMYQVFLGPSIFYGIELLLTVLVVRSITGSKEVL